MKSAYSFNRSEGYFEGLLVSTQDIIHTLVTEIAENVRRKFECYKDTDECVESIECHSRDGFIPFSHNRGGLRVRNFTDVSSLGWSGCRVAHKRAQEEIERQVEYAYELARESLFENHRAELAKLGIDSKDHEKLNYHDLYELGQGQLAERLSEAEHDYMSGDESSIMFEVRFMYHGCENGIHSASVSCAVNTEGPYHRSHISWAPNVFCEGAKEIEITWRTEGGLKRKLASALKRTSGEVF